ncbi:MAG: uroporphyrinogen-III C-methyltransferase [Flavobacteriaceae bacterium]
MSSLSKGSLTLVGAGPGDPDLLTFKGLKAIQKAHVILYDALINPLLLEHNPTAEKIFVGKRRDFIKKTQKEINELILKYAIEGLDVVRLKGGDPMVFGRACEELNTAREAQIPTNVVPGIASYAGIAAQHQIPLTKRAEHESFWVVTGHTRSGKLSSDIALAAQSTATVVVLMGMRFLPEIVATFKKHQRGDHPVAVIQNGTTPAEKSLVADLDTIVYQVKKYKIDNPAVLIFGLAASDPVTHYKNWIHEETIVL